MKIFFYTCFFIVLASCSKQAEEKKDILPRQKFVSVLIRMHMIEGRISLNQMLDQGVVDRSYAEYEKLFTAYNTDSTVVSKTLDHYKNRYDEFKSIYQEVLDSLVARANASVNKK